MEEGGDGVAGVLAGGCRAAVRLQGAHTDGADRLCLQEAYESVVEYFGENSKTTPPSMFFSLFSRFVKAYKVCFWWAGCSLSTWVAGGAGAASVWGAR